LKKSTVPSGTVLFFDLLPILIRKTIFSSDVWISRLDEIAALHPEKVIPLYTLTEDVSPSRLI
jgi:hypothetical protein